MSHILSTPGRHHLGAPDAAVVSAIVASAAALSLGGPTGAPAPPGGALGLLTAAAVLGVLTVRLAALSAADAAVVIATVVSAAALFLGGPTGAPAPPGGALGLLTAAAVLGVLTVRLAALRPGDRLRTTAARILTPPQA